MVDDRLFGKKRGGAYEPIRPETITFVREYGFNNPYLLVISDGRKYTVRPWVKDFDAIVDFLEEHTEFEVKGSLAHSLNTLFFKPWITRCLFGSGKRRNGGK